MNEIVSSECLALRLEGVLTTNALLSFGIRFNNDFFVLLLDERFVGLVLDGD